MSNKRFGKSFFNRPCKRCGKLFKKLSKHSRTCPNCDKRRDYLKSYRIKNVLLIFGLIFSLILGMFINQTSTLALGSVSYECATSPAQRSNFQVSGYYSLDTKEIVLYDQDPKVLMHELCHYNQDFEGRANNCKNPNLLYLNEFECYASEIMPRTIFNMIYKETTKIK